MTSFDGTKESCPNYIDDELDQRWLRFSGEQEKDGDSSREIDPQFGSETFNKICFNICETHTISDEGTLTPLPNPTFIDSSGNCRTCVPDGATDDPNNPPIGSRQFLINAGKYEMCNDENDLESGGRDNQGVPLWFTRQQAANMSRMEGRDRINWSGASSETEDTNSEAYKIQQYWKSTNKPLSNEEILRLIGNRTAGTLEYTLPEEYMKEQPLGMRGEVTVDVFDFEKLRRDINKGRGSVVYCDRSIFTETDTGWFKGAAGTLRTPTVENPDYRKCWDGDTQDYIDEVGNYGPEHIIAEEVEDFVTELLDKIRSEESASSSGAVKSFSELLSGLSLDSNFEACVNDKLNTGDNDYERQESIKKYTKIAEFTGQDMNYLKRKLKKIITIKSNELNECMSLLNLGESICVTGVADKTLQIGSLIFSIVGNNAIDVLNADNDDRMKLNKMIDELGPLIPQAVKNIIHVSKEYESRICNVPSNTTLLLERLYIDLYDKEVHVNLDISPYIDFNSLINMEPWKFGKTICVILVFSFLFMQFANIIVAFLSRGSTVTKIA